MGFENIINNTDAAHAAKLYRKRRGCLQLCDAGSRGILYGVLQPLDLRLGSFAPFSGDCSPLLLGGGGGGGSGFRWGAMHFRHRRLSVFCYACKRIDISCVTICIEFFRDLCVHSLLRCATLTHHRETSIHVCYNSF